MCRTGATRLADMSTVADVLVAAEQLWPAAGAESWDAVGLVSGHPERPVRRILCVVDVVATTVDEAIETRADLVLSHHPLLLHGVTSIAETEAKGHLLARLIRADCALLSAHTNADITVRGTSAVFANGLQLGAQQPIVAAADGVTGLGRVGRLPEPITLRNLADRTARLLPPTATGVRVAGDADLFIATVAICAGAGDSLLAHPAVRAADAYITADLRHHPASEAAERVRLGYGPALLDVSHWASEWLWLAAAAADLAMALRDVEIVVSTRRTDPWDFRCA